MATPTSQRQSRPVRRNATSADTYNRYYGSRQARNTATAQEYIPYREYQPRRQPAAEPVKVKQPVARAGGQRKKAFGFLARVGIMFIMCFMMIYRYAVILEANDKITTLNSQLLDAEYNNQAIRARIDRGLELGALEEYATEELGMIRPDNSQVFYVDIQLGDEAEGNNNNSENKTLQGTPGALVNAFRVLN